MFYLTYVIQLAVKILLKHVIMKVKNDKKEK